jgi:hypothetical protein
VRYLDSCTTPADRVLVTWSAPEYYFFARRPFAAGHALFLPKGFRSESDQQQMIHRVEEHRVPIALFNEDQHEEFARAYPLFAEHLRAAYMPVGEFEHYDGSRVTVAVDRRLKATRAFEPYGWPCGFVWDSSAAHS